MSRGARYALATLVAVLALAPAAAFHPVISHVSVAGAENALNELTHPSLVGLLIAALVPTLPAVGFFLLLGVRAATGAAQVHGLMRDSYPARLGDDSYRVVPAEAPLVFTAGLLRPATFVTSGARRALAEGELRAALYHEEGHRRGQDLVWRLLLNGVGRCFGFIPRISDVVRAETLRSECAADDYAIRRGARRMDLFEAIVAVSAVSPGGPAAGLAGDDIEFRLTRLARPGVAVPGRSAGHLLWLAVALGTPALGLHALGLAAAMGTSSLMV